MTVASSYMTVASSYMTVASSLLHYKIITSYECQIVTSHVIREWQDISFVGFYYFITNSEIYLRIDITSKI